MDEIQLMIEIHKPAIFGLGEANIGVHCHPPALEIPGFILERDNLVANGIRTRTAAYISDKLTYKRRLDLECANTPLIWLEIFAAKPKSWLLALGYRQWRTLNKKKNVDSGSTSAQLERLSKWGDSWEKAGEEGKQIVIIGDLNIDVGPWSDPSAILTPYQVSKASLLAKLKELSYQLNLSLIKTECTRIQGTQKPSTLDIILSSHSELIEAPKLFLTSSDHKLLCFSKNATIKIVKQPIRKTHFFF